MVGRPRPCPRRTCVCAPHPHGQRLQPARSVTPSRTPKSLCPCPLAPGHRRESLHGDLRGREGREQAGAGAARRHVAAAGPCVILRVCQQVRRPRHSTWPVSAAAPRPRGAPSGRNTAAVPPASPSSDSSDAQPWPPSTTPQLTHISSCLSPRSSLARCVHTAMALLLVCALLTPAADLRLARQPHRRGRPLDGQGPLPRRRALGRVDGHPRGPRGPRWRQGLHGQGCVRLRRCSRRLC